jgi:hypothetical protein
VDLVEHERGSLTKITDLVGAAAAGVSAGECRGLGLGPIAAQDLDGVAARYRERAEVP